MYDHVHKPNVLWIAGHAQQYSNSRMNFDHSFCCFCAALVSLLESEVRVFVRDLLGNRVFPELDSILVVHLLPVRLPLVLLLLFPLLQCLLLALALLSLGRGGQGENGGRCEDHAAGEAHGGRVDDADGGDEAAAVPVAPLARQAVVPVSFS